MLPNEKKNKQILLDDKIEIQDCLCKGTTFSAISKRIEKTYNAIKDVKNHSIIYDSMSAKPKDTCQKFIKAPFGCLTTKKTCKLYLSQAPKLPPPRNTPQKLICGIYHGKSHGI